MKLYKSIVVDLYNPHPLPKMTAQQYNVGRGALITLTANGQVITPNNETVRIFAKRPDGNVSYLDCIFDEDGKIQADFTDQMLAAEGSVQVELELTTKETNITTPIFIVEVNKSNVKNGVKSSNEYKALEKYTEESLKAAEEAKEASDTAQRVLESIPEDYKTAVELVKATAITSSASGTTIHTTDSAKAKPNITTFGKGTQNTYLGTNILPQKIVSNGTGLNITLDEQKQFICNGTTLDRAAVDMYIYGGWSDSITDIGIRGELTISCSDESLQMYIIHNDGSSTGVVKQGKGSITFTVTDENYITGISIRFPQNTAYNKTIRVWANYGATQLDYEPYVGNAPSPSLTYPQKVTPIGESGSVKHTLYARNLIDWNGKLKTEINGLTNSIQSDGGIKVVGTNTVAYTNIISLEKRLPAGTYFISGGERQALYAQAYYQDEISGNPIYAHHSAFTLTKETLVYISVQTSDKLIEHNTVIYPMLNIGSEKAEFSPYIKEQTITLQTPNGLHGIPLGVTIPDTIKNSPIHMSGVYWDEVEQQYYISDTKNENGKDVQRVSEYVVTGTETYTMWSNGDAVALNRQFNAYIYLKGLCNYYLNKGLSDIHAKHIRGFTLNYQYNQICFYEEGYDSTTLKTKFAEMYAEGNPVKVYGILAEPIITDTSVEELEQYNAVHMNYPNTTIVNDAGAYMEVEYVADTKEHIKQNYTPNSVTQDILERLGNVEAQLVLES